MTEMIRIKKCPQCGSERPLKEVLCQNEVNGGSCSYQLIMVRPTWPGKGDATPAAAQSHRETIEEEINETVLSASAGQTTCSNGHVVDPNDLLCPICGTDTNEAELPESDPKVERILSDWIVVSEAAHVSGAERRVVARSVSDGRLAVITIYHEGSEPDTDVYSVLQNLDADHIATVYETGRHEGRPYEVTEFIAGGTLSDFIVHPNDLPTIKRIIDEVARALNDFSRVGLRHRDLTPNAITIRTVEPLDLVIEGFGSACLSEFDLDVVSPLETSLYMAPEAVAGGVTAASDWWSLGMILLQKITPETFVGVNEKAFLIQTLTAGVSIPSDIDKTLANLLSGLLIRDRDSRFGYAEVKSWLDGEEVPVPAEHYAEEINRGLTIDLGSNNVDSVKDYALRAAESENWEEAKDHLLRGKLASWSEEAGLDARALAQLRTISRREINDDFKLGIALKILNPNMPLVQKSEIVNPGWLLAFPEEGYDLITGEASIVLGDLKMEPWIGRLRERATVVKVRAKAHQIDLDEGALKINLLSTSRTRLLALWEERRKLFPDTDRAGLASIVDRKQRTEEDLIILLSADIGQFQSIDDIIEETLLVAQKAGLNIHGRDFFKYALTTMTRRDLFRKVAERIADFARCGEETVDSWADQFRLERRTSLPRALVMLAVPEDYWEQPSDQVYVFQILKHYAAKVELQIKQGPLARMKISKSSDKIDLTEFESEGPLPSAFVNKILERSDSVNDLTTRRVVEDPAFASRIRKLVNRASLYKRDTGIDGLYMGFPFAVLQAGSKSTRPRISPILLWPVKITAEVGRSAFSAAYDVDREEVRVNPALEGYLGPEEFARWRAAAEELQASTVTIASAVDEFGLFGKPMATTLCSLPSDSVNPDPGEIRIYPAAVFFHMTFMGQEVIENLRFLKGIPPGGTALESLLRLRGEAEEEPAETVREFERYFVAPIDPSQEAAVAASRQMPGVIISGPPGTGKSQSLVNIVSDCIGRGESILICCAKQAALDVVRKRVAGEKLGNRMIMVEDVNKDRAPVLRKIRDLLDIALSGSDNYDRIQAARRETAAKIEAREAELNEYHTALYEQIGETGRTYRDVVAELVVIEDNVAHAPIDAPAVRSLVAGMSLSNLVELEEKVAPIVLLWIDARPGGSENHRLKRFGWEKAICDRYRSDLAALSAAESDRVGQLPYDTDVFPVENIEEAKSICERIIGDYPTGKPSTRYLYSWVDMFDESVDSAGDKLLNELIAVAGALLEIDTDRHSDRFFKATVNEKASFLAYLKTKIEKAISQSAFRFLNPGWYFAQKEVRNFINRYAAPYSSPLVWELLEAVELELDIRETRKKASNLARTSGYSAQFAFSTVGDLMASLKGFIEVVHDVKTFAEATDGIPGRAAMKTSLKLDKPEALLEFHKALGHSIDRAQKTKFSHDKLASMREWLSDETLEEWRTSIDRDADTLDLVGGLEADADAVEAYQRYRHQMRDATLEMTLFFEQLSSVRRALSKIHREKCGDEVRRIINREARLAWRQDAEEKTTALSLQRNEINNKVKALSDLDNEMCEHNCHLLGGTFDREKLGAKRDWERITRLQGPRAMRLREFMGQGIDVGLLELIPVWMMNPDVAARMLPMKAGMFDVVVFDESSQLPVEYALHVLYRAKRVVISGDAKQMPPTQFFQSRIEDDQAEIEGGIPDEDVTEEERGALEREENSRDIKDCTDLLQLASVPLPKHVLQIHYRSRYRELIGFSNAAFYNNALHVPVRHPESLVKSYKPLEFVQVNGIYRDQTNEDEAKAVVDRLAGIWKETCRPPSIGVITFNRKQADLINAHIEKRAEIDGEFRKVLARESGRNDHGEDMAFFVMNVENCQGLERDQILFSSTFARNDQGSFRRLFGVLGQKGGERRLNVAVTRAREKVVFFTSMPVGEISDFLSANRAPAVARDFLQGYLQYARLLSDGSFAPARTLLEQMLEGGGADKLNGSAPPDGFSLIVAEFIRNLGFEPVSARDGTAFAIDYALEHPKTGRFFLGIECDAPNSDLLVKPRDREIWRPKVLKMGIPRIHRVSSVGWYASRDIEKSLLQRAISNAFKEVKVA